MATDDEAIYNECRCDLIINVAKSNRNLKKRSNCPSVSDYISKLLSNSDIAEKIALKGLHYLTANNEIKNQPTNGRDSYYIKDEMSVLVENPPNPSNESNQGPVSYDITLIKDIEKLSSLNSIRRLIKTIITKK